MVEGFQKQKAPARTGAFRIEKSLGFSKSGTPQGELFMATPAGSGLWPFTEISVRGFPDHLGQFIKGFGQDLEGEIYVTTSTVLGPAGTSGKVYKLVLAN